jgi:hypothetical protein
MILDLQFRFYRGFGKYTEEKRLVLALFNVVAILSNHSTKADAKIRILLETIK